MDDATQALERFLPAFRRDPAIGWCDPAEPDGVRVERRRVWLR